MKIFLSIKNNFFKNNALFIEAFWFYHILTKNQDFQELFIEWLKNLFIKMKKYKPEYAVKVSSKNFGFEDNIKSIPLYAIFCI